MKFGVPWSVEGIPPEARETAKEAARRSGMSLGEWLNSLIIQQTEMKGVHRHSDDAGLRGGELANVNERLDDLSRRIEQLMRTGPAAYAPKRSHDESNQIAQLIARLDHRLDQFANSSRPMAPPLAPAMMPAAMPAVQLPPSLDHAVAEITARRRALNGEPASARPQQWQATTAPQARTPSTPAFAPAFAPVPSQDLSGLEEHLRQITNQIETLRQPGVAEAINALRAELGEIGRALNDAMPRRAIDTIEKQIQELTQRIAEGRQAGIDGSALSGIEHGLAEVRDALRSLTPAENLIGFNEAIASLAHKIDLIVAQKDPETLGQLERAIITLRDMATHVASNEAVSELAAQVQMLGDKVEHFVATGGARDALNNIEQRISVISDALAERTQSGGTVPPRLEALVQSLSDKIELIQQSHGDNVAVGHLEDRIVSLVERLDASDTRLGHLEAIERGLADLLVHIEEMRANKGPGGLREESSPGFIELKHDIARTQDTLEAVHGTLGQVVDRLAIIENDFRGEGRARNPIVPDTAEIKPPVGKVAARMISDEPQQTAATESAPAPVPVPPAAAATPAAPVAPAPALPVAPAPPPAAVAPKRLPPAGHLPINPDLPPDLPLEPGSGPPPLHANPAARIAASEAALGTARPMPTAATGGKSDFIAAARRAAQAAIETSGPRAPRAEPIEMDETKSSSLRASVMRRIKSLFIAASVVAIVIGSIQIVDKVPDLGGSRTPKARSAQGSDIEAGKSATATTSIEPETPSSLAAKSPSAPIVPEYLSSEPTPGANFTAKTPPPDLNPAVQGFYSLLNPPALNPPALASNGDITGSLSRTTVKSRPATPLGQQQDADQLPTAIGSTRLRDAAVAGDAAAAYEVAVRFAEGRGVPANLEEAARWYERAAGRGLAPAQFRYASLLEKGQGVKKDLGKARRLYLSAATKGHAKAMHNLAVLYAEGIEGKPDYATAALWFQKAAQRGIADSQYNLGVLCARGLGTEKNVAESYKWFALAAAQGDREAAKKRDDVAAHLDADALSAAQHAVKGFVAVAQPHDATTVSVPPGGWDNVTHTPPPDHVRPQATRALSANTFEVGKR